MKPILLFATLIILILTGCKTGDNKKTGIGLQQNCIKRILALDSSLGSKRNNECIEVSLSTTIDHYVDSLSVLDFSECPGSFSAVFKKHIEAWEDMKEVTDNFPGIRGEMHDLFDHIETTQDSTQFKKLLAEVWSTWEVIEKESSVY